MGVREGFRAALRWQRTGIRQTPLLTPPDVDGDRVVLFMMIQAVDVLSDYSQQCPVRFHSHHYVVSVLWPPLQLRAAEMASSVASKAMFSAAEVRAAHDSRDCVWCYSTFAITPVLVVVAFAERMRFGACLLFAAL
jgi:hypothetical protein